LLGREARQRRDQLGGRPPHQLVRPHAEDPHVILCRNVLIYFADATTVAVVDRLSGALRPGGVLAVSVTESLLRFGTSLECEERDGVFFYRKVAS
jgi:chemotaxis protein methyltransferase CheR